MSWSYRPPAEGEVHWAFGEEMMRRNVGVPGGFIFVYAVVMAWLHTVNAGRQLRDRLASRLSRQPQQTLSLPAPTRLLPPPRSQSQDAE